MPLHPDVEAFLELAELSRLSGKSQPMSRLPVEQARAEFEQTSPLLDGDPPQDLDVTTHRYPARDGHPLQARLYRKPGAPDAQPVLLYFHGGGYVVGSLDSHDALCRRLAQAGDCAILALDYRLAPEWPFPTAVLDALDGANWLAEQARNLGLDPARTAFGGDSVGATLATVLTLHACHHPATLALRPRAQVLLYPVTDVSCKRPSHARYAEGHLLETDTLDWFYHHYLPNPADREDWRVSPLLADTLHDLPPTYLGLAEYDPLHDEGLTYAQRLRDAGNVLHLDTQHGLTHDYMRMAGLVAEVEELQRGLMGWVVEQMG